MLLCLDGVRDDASVKNTALPHRTMRCVQREKGAGLAQVVKGATPIPENPSSSLGKAQPYLGHILVISWSYLGHILVISS